MNAKILLGIVVLFGTGLMVGYVGHDFFSVDVPSNNTDTGHQDTSHQIREIGRYTYINPLLECEAADGLVDGRKENFQHALEKYASHMKQEKRLTDLSVYFRDLNNGPAFGINEQGEFFPASLLKVPIMMAYYHLAEQDSSILEIQIAFNQTKDFGILPAIVPRESLVLGESYTVDDLIRRMIVFSDNQALSLLSERLPLPIIEDLFAMLGVGGDVLVNANSKLTVKEYAGFFRILFNSSYLSREYSEKALALLATTDYHDALSAGVSEGIAVAHKFGEAGTGNIERQLHDCGIVYFPNHPYLACIMTRGYDTEALKNSIRDISRFIYEKIDAQY